MEGYYKFIAGPRREQIQEFLEIWDDPDIDGPDAIIEGLDDKGIIQLLREIVRE